MRLALLSDIHGNPIALDAVLSDVQQQGGADAYWVLGDVVAIGHDPVAVLERLAGLPNVQVCRGNTDRYVATDQRPEPHPDAVRADPALLPRLLEVAQGFAWTKGYLTGAGWLEWLDRLPLELRLTLPDGTRLLGAHASPGHDDGDGIHPELSDAQLAALLAGCDAGLVCVGHTHWPLDRTVDVPEQRGRGRVRVVNLGSVSNPPAPDLRASYVLLDATGSGYQLQHRRVAYDLQASVDAVERSRFPAAAFVNQHFLGRRRPRWEQPVTVARSNERA